MTPGQATATRPRMDPRIGRRRAEVTRARGRRRLRLVLAVGGLLAVGVGALVVLHSSLFSARHVTVVGAAHTGPTAVLQAAGLRGSPPLIDVNGGAAAGRVEALPWVGRATVARRWPDSVVVRVTERVPVAVVPARGAFFLVDASGRVLERVPMAPAGVPFLTSPAPPGGPGTTLGRAAQPGLEVVAAAEHVLPDRVAGVTVGPRGSVILDLGKGVRATLGATVGPPSAVGSKLAALASVLAGTAPTGPELIDVSVPGEPTVSPGASASS